MGSACSVTQEINGENWTTELFYDGSFSVTVGRGRSANAALKKLSEKCDRKGLPAPKFDPVAMQYHCGTVEGRTVCFGKVVQARNTVFWRKVGPDIWHAYTFYQ